MAGKPWRVMFHNGGEYVRSVVLFHHGGDGNPVDVQARDGDNIVRDYYNVPQVEGPDAPEAGGNTYYVES